MHMTNPHVPKHATDFIEKLTALDPKPDAVWLIGSRANQRATKSSDTDLLIFGSLEFITTATKNLAPPIGIDCLVVYNGNDYSDPWQKKSGSLSNLRWRQESGSTASYVGIKWIPDEIASAGFEADLGEMRKLDERAVRIWPQRR